jgi:hypothetical protein
VQFDESFAGIHLVADVSQHPQDNSSDERRHFRHGVEIILSLAECGDDGRYFRYGGMAGTYPRLVRR